MPCILYGDEQLPHSHKHIVQSIFTELLNSAKAVLSISRNGDLFHVLPLEESNGRKGMVYYTNDSGETVDTVMISNCLIPLLLRS